MTRRLSDIQGKPNAEYNDVEVRLLIRNSAKEANAPAQGDLAEVLRILELTDDCCYWDIKRETWRLLGLENPVRLPTNERKTIRQRSIDNSGEITILRNTEGRTLNDRLNLPPDPEKDYLERTLLNRIRELGAGQIE